VPRWLRGQRLTIDQALRLLTTGGAYGIFAEDDLGMIAPGMLADLVVLSEDPHDVPRAELERIDVLMVFVGGILEVCSPESTVECPAN
jgi:predicted amidohydrolase YtcJ